MKQSNHQLINQTSGDFEYYTPPEIVDAARQVMRAIDLDPASSHQANQVIRALRIFTIQDNGLNHRWSGKVWLNHPFSRENNPLWITHLVNQVKAGYVKEACCITYACTSEQWFKPLLLRPQCFLIPRTNYLMPNGQVKRGVTKGSVVTYFGKHPGIFSRVFGPLGVVKLSWMASWWMTEYGN